MPNFEFTSPEGKKYTVSGPDGSTKEQAFGILQGQIKSGSASESKSQPLSDQIPGGGVSGSRNAGKEGEESYFDKAVGVGEAGLGAITGMATGLAAPFAGAYGGLTGGIKKQNEMVDKTMGAAYQPRTDAGQRYLGNVGDAMRDSGVGGLAGMNEMQSLGHLASPALKQANRLSGEIAAPIGRQVDRIPTVVKNAPDRVIRPISETISDITGSRVAPAQKIAGKSAREAISESQREQNALSIGEQKHARDMESVRIALENNLEQHKNSMPTTHSLGTGIRGLYNSAVDSAKKSREAQADIDYPLVQKAAEQKEAQGLRVDIKPVLDPLKQLRSDAAGIKSIQIALDEIESAVKLPSSEKVSAPVIVDKFGAPIARSSAETSGKTVRQLQLALRKLNDIAYNGKDLGFDAIVTNDAKLAAKTLDEQIQSFVPEHAVAKENYARLSEPLDSLNTRLGKAITGTEGGFSRDAFSKVAAGTLPDKLFANPEGVSLLKEALSGGKNASPEAMAQASKQVNSLMEQWILSKDSTSSAKSSLEGLKAPV